MQNIEIELIKIDGGTQRRQLDSEVSDHYASLLKEAVEFPPIELIHTGRHFYVWDGFHRLSAAKMIDAKTIKANVRSGTLDEAVWLSYSANTKHGLPRKPGQVKKAIQEILSNPKWSCKTDKEIAEHINCSRETVVRLRTSQNQIENVRCCDDVSLSVKSNPELPKGNPVEDTPPVEAEESESVCDNVGNPIPPELAGLWQDNHSLKKYIDMLNLINRDFEDMIARKDLKIALLNPSRFKADLFNLKSLLSNLIFYAMCPYCPYETVDGKCRACKGLGFTNQSNYEVSPSEYRNPIPLSNEQLEVSDEQEVDF